MGAVINRKLLPKMTTPMLMILVLVRIDVYLRGLQIAVKRSKAMARRTPDSMQDSPWTKKVWAMQASSPISWLISHRIPSTVCTVDSPMQRSGGPAWPGSRTWARVGLAQHGSHAAPGSFLRAPWHRYRRRGWRARDSAAPDQGHP